jgi:hypothetical protein
VSAVLPLNISRPGSWDNETETVRVVRQENGSSRLIAVHNALPWVLRAKYLRPEDVD